jgi:hypothetical protein
MAVANGYGKVVTSGSVFMYDTGDTINSYIGEPTTNIFKHYGTTGQGSGADNGVSFDVNGTGTFIRLGYGQVFGGYTIQPNDVVYKYNLGEYGCHYHGNDVTIASGVYVTFTFDYYISPGAGGYPETNYLANMETSTGASVSIASPNSLTGVWQTISVTTGPTTSGGNLRPLLYPGACGGRLASSGYVLFKNPQVELLPHKTPFTQTTRSATQGLLPIVGNSTINLTNVSFDSNAQMVFDGTNDYVNIGTNSSLAITGDITICAWVYINNFSSTYNSIIGKTTSGGMPAPYDYYMNINTGRLVFLRGNGSVYAYTTSTASPALNTWQFVAVTMSGTTITHYLNGETNGIDTASTTIADNGDNALVGSRGDSVTKMNGKINTLQIYNRALSAAEVQQNYSKYKSRFNLS